MEQRRETEIKKDLPRTWLGTRKDEMTEEEIKQMVVWFCDRNELELPTTKEELDAIYERMIRIGLLSRSDLET